MPFKPTQPAATTPPTYPTNPPPGILLPTLICAKLWFCSCNRSLACPLSLPALSSDRGKCPTLPSLCSTNRAASTWSRSFLLRLFACPHTTLVTPQTSMSVPFSTSLLSRFDSDSIPIPLPGSDVGSESDSDSKWEPHN